MDYKHLIRFFLQKLKKDNIGAYAAQAALFIIMSAIPFFFSLSRFLDLHQKNFKQIIHFCTHQKNVHTDVQPEHQQEDRSQTAI